MTKGQRVWGRVALVVCALGGLAGPALADLDGHGPDAWRVNGVASNDSLNARMGPGTNYRVIETFAHNERGLQQVTCVPFYTMKHYSAMSQSEINALPQRWCLMRSADLTKAGWVAQRFITPDDAEAAFNMPASNATTPNPGATPAAADRSGDGLVNDAAQLVADLYNAFPRATSQASDPFSGANARNYFMAALAPKAAGQGGIILYDAQDFDGRVTRIAPDAGQAMFRGMITINVDFTNFGQQKRAVYRLRADTDQPGAPFRIMSVEHDSWTFE